jgi:hypothetical protein
MMTRTEQRFHVSRITTLATKLRSRWQRRPVHLELLCDQIQAGEHVEYGERQQQLAETPVELVPAPHARVPTPRASRLSTQRGRLVRGALVILLLAAIIAPVAVLRHAPRASAAPDQAAAAANSAGTFAFVSESELIAGQRRLRASRTTGEVNLRQKAVQSTVTEAGARSGLQRIVFPDAIYARTTAGRASQTWVGSRLSPPASISVRTGSGGGLGDVTGLLAVLSHLHRATFVETRRDGRILTWAYTVTSTIGALVAIEGGSVKRALTQTPVTIEVWQDQRNHLIRAVRTFTLPGARQLRVTTRFRRYGEPTSIERPCDCIVGSQQLTPFADDPIEASIVTALTVGVGHPSAAASSPQTPRSAPSRSTAHGERAR